MEIAARLGCTVKLHMLRENPMTCIGNGPENGDGGRSTAP